MDTAALISYVRKNPAIWDKRLKSHSDRNVVDECWREIAERLGVEDAALRKKWKYLRDQFTVELGKIKASRSEDVSVVKIEPKWLHFKSLLFLQDVVKPRQLTMNSTSKNFEKFSETISEVKASEPERAVLDFDDREDEVDDVSGTFESYNDIPECPSSADNCHIPQDTCKRKRLDSNSIYNSSVTYMEKTNANSIEKLIDRQEENEDLLFFRSLLPHLKNIPQNKKLRFRNRIQEVVGEFAYPSEFLNL